VPPVVVVRLSSFRAGVLGAAGAAGAVWVSGVVTVNSDLGAAGECGRVAASAAAEMPLPTTSATMVAWIFVMFIWLTPLSS
jgi:hypothetical protein